MDRTAGLQVIIYSGPRDAQRATLGFAAAAAACACGMAVNLFLAMDGSRWALSSEGNEPEVPGFQPVAELLETVMASGGRVEVCSTCVDGVCTVPAGNRAQSTLRPGVVPGGLATVVIRMASVPTVTF